MLDALRQDVRYSFRVLARSPGFTAAVVLTLALSIGANTALFSLFNALVLRPLAVREPQRLAVISATDERGTQPRFIYASTFDELRTQQQAFETLSLYSGGGVLRVEARGVMADAGVEATTPAYFEMLGIQPFLGRLISDADTAVGGAGAPVVVIGHRFWQRLFGGDPHAVGETLEVEGTPLTIVGVTPPGFYGLQADGGADFFTPIATLRPISGDPKRPLRAWNVIGRLRSGVTFDQARAEMLARWPSIQRETVPPGFTAAEQADMQRQRVTVDSIETGFSGLRQRYASPLGVLVGLTALLLAIGCANLSGLLLARAMARDEQRTIRVALGASRARLVQQLLVESLLLSAAGAALALPLAWWASRALGATLWADALRPLVKPMTPDARVLAAAAAAAVGTGLLVGMLPAWLATGDRANLAFRSSRSVAASSGRAGSVLLVAQIALSLMLLVGAGLFSKSLSNVRANDSVFPTARIVWTRLWLMPGQRGATLPASYYLEVVTQLGRIPEAESVALSTLFPALFNFSARPESFAAADAADASLEVAGLSEVVSPGFFQTVGIVRLQGRDFTWDDDERAPPMAIVSVTLARRLFPNGDAVGRRVRMGRIAATRTFEIVGVVDDAPIGNIRDPHVAVLFRPMLQELQRARVPIAHVRASHDVNAVRAAYPSVVASLGRHYVRNVYTLEEQVDQSLLQERLVAWCSSFFAALAVLIACVGVYALLAHAVARRTREIGVRMALGATRRSVLRMIAWQGFALAAIGVAVGVPCALAAGRFAASLLYGLAPTDPPTIVGAAATFIAVAAVSGLIPAYRAATIDPIAALRHE